MDNLKFAEMLCTRFCHDIIGPVGAVSNGVEFLREEMPELKSQATDLIESSAKEAVSRAQFYRQAYGTAGNGPASLTEMKQLATNYFAAGKIKLDWADKFTDMSGVEINHAQKKFILNLLIVSSATLTRGGVIKFEIDKSGFSIESKGDKCALQEPFEACLEGKANGEVEPRLVQCFYTQQYAKQNGFAINIKKGADSVTLSAKF